MTLPRGKAIGGVWHRHATGLMILLVKGSGAQRSPEGGASSA